MSSYVKSKADFVYAIFKRQKKKIFKMQPLAIP